MRITTQRLRNLTTGKLHTEIWHIYEDLGAIIGEQGLMTHMIPNALKAVLPWLKAVTGNDEAIWDDRYDPNATGSYDLPDPTADERVEMMIRYRKMANPLSGFMDS